MTRIRRGIKSAFSPPGSLAVTVRHCMTASVTARHHLVHGPPSHRPVRHRMRAKADSIVRSMRRGSLMRSDEEMWAVYRGPSGEQQPSSIRIRNWQRISLVFAHSPTPYISVDDIAEGVQGNIAPKNRCRCPFRGAEAARCCLDPPKPLLN